MKISDAGSSATPDGAIALDDIGVIPPIRSSSFAASLAAAGLDIRNLPPLSEIVSNKKQLHAVMHSFKSSLGFQCRDCHMQSTTSTGSLDFAAATPEKAIAENMWDRFARGLEFKSGGNILYCDSCHQGRAKLLQGDQDSVGPWMAINFVAPLQAKDGSPIACATCHGPAFDLQFLEKWTTVPPTPFNASGD